MEHRHGVRHQMMIRASIRGPNGDSMRAVVCNVSISGAFIRLPECKWRTFTTVDVCAMFPGPYGELARDITAMIVRVVPDGIGVMFDKPDTNLAVAFAMHGRYRGRYSTDVLAGTGHSSNSGDG